MKEKIIVCITLIILMFFLSGCTKSQEQINAENKALSLVHFEASAIYESFSADFTIDVEDLFYVLGSHKYQEGYCVEIASKERIPPKYKERLAPITTLPIFVTKLGKASRQTTGCITKAYPDNQGRVISLMNARLRDQEGTYSVLKFFLIREVGNAISKIRLKEMGYEPNYAYNPVAEYFTDTFLLETLKDQKFNKTLGIYTEAEFEINGEEMIKSYVDSLE